MTTPSFIIKQLEEALEERQGSDRRKQDGQDSHPSEEDRRVSNRRDSKQSKHH